MNFSIVTPDENFPFMKWASENGRWEFGFVPVLHGVRVNITLCQSEAYGGYAVTYCCGDDMLFAWRVLVAVAEIMGGLPEEISEGSLASIFPSWERRPINLDGCWDRLQALAEEYRQRSAWRSMRMEVPA